MNNSPTRRFPRSVFFPILTALWLTENPIDAARIENAQTLSNSRDSAHAKKKTASLQGDLRSRENWTRRCIKTAKFNPASQAFFCTGLADLARSHAVTCGRASLVHTCRGNRTNYCPNLPLSRTNAGRVLTARAAFHLINHVFLAGPTQDFRLRQKHSLAARKKGMASFVWTQVPHAFLAKVLSECALAIIKKNIVHFSHAIPPKKPL